MKFELFSKLYDEAFNYDDCDRYVAERGWQEWMNAYVTDENDNDASVISNILFTIYDLSRMDIKEMHKVYGITFNDFSKMYSIPVRTIEDWEYGKNRTPIYIKKLVAYTLLIRRLEDEQN